MEAVRIIKEMRNATKQLSMRGSDGHIRVYPSIAIWENVPGALSSGSPRGADFRCVLEELARIENPEVSIPMPKKWGGAGWIDLPHGCITWRVHDAQFWGVPQRRKRISLVVDFREEPKPEIQFISDSVSGNFETSEESRKTVARIIGEGVDSAISFQERAGKPGGVKGSLSNETESDACQHSTIKPLCIGGGQVHDAISPSEVCKTLNTMDDPMKVLVPNGGVTCYGIDRASFNQGQNAKYDISIQEDIAQPIVARGPGGGNADKVNALCARDWKGVGSQYVRDGKCIIQDLRCKGQR